MINISRWLSCFFTAVFLMAYFNAAAQSIEWDKNFGGSQPSDKQNSGQDQAYAIEQTPDSGYVVAGHSGSEDGDISQNNGEEDYWVLKLDASGNIDWKNNYGGTLEDFATSVHQTNDDGYIVAGHSQSNSADVHGNYGSYDWWLVKLNASGDTIWTNNYGGSAVDYCRSVQQTDDNGFIVAGYSTSSDNDVPGNYGSEDFWVVKLNNDGDTLWTQNYGGSGSDDAYSIRQTDDGGYVVAGFSTSSDNDVSGNVGPNAQDDFWVVKLNADGTIARENNFGSRSNDQARSVRQTEDGGYIIAGFSEAGSGHVDDNYGGRDVWVVKTDEQLNMEWNSNIGGSEDDFAYAVREIDSDSSSYIVSGYSASSDTIVSGNYGGRDVWVVALDSSGNIQWESNYGGGGDEEAYSIQQTLDSGYAVAGYSDSADQDVSGNYGKDDYWVFKLSKKTYSDDDGDDNGDDTTDTGVFNTAPQRDYSVRVQPNPFEKATRIEYQIKKATNVTLAVYDAQGKKVKTIKKGYQNPGTYSYRIQLNEKPGLYFYRLETSEGVDAGKMIFSGR